MPQFPWIRHSSIWIGCLDEEHALIIKLIGNVVSATLVGDHDKAARNVSLFVEAASAHFAYEEALMQAFAYPKAEGHAAKHRFVYVDVLKLERAVMQRSGEATVVPLANEISANFHNLLFPDDIGLISHIERVKSLPSERAG